MPRVLALDWDHRELRCLLASVGGARVKLHLAAAVPLGVEAEADRSGQAEAGLALQKLLAQERSSRLVSVVGVNRANIELLELTLPPAKDSELPELVLHQAMHESPAVTEDAALDYFTLGNDASQPRKVVAAALAPERRERIQAVCAQAGLKASRIVVRSLASASLFRSAAADAQRVCLLVDRVGEEMDLTLMVDGQAVFLRTARLPADSDRDKLLARLLAEIRRTLAVINLEDHGAEAVEAIYVFGRRGQYQDLIQQIGNELEVPTAEFDVFQAAGVPPDQVPESDASFSALLGMVLDEARNAHRIDFCRTRKAAGPSQTQRRLILVAVAALILVLGGGYYVWDRLALADAQNKVLAKELKDLNTLMKKGSDQNKVVEAVQEWLAGDVSWLDELRDLSIRFPKGRDMIVLRMTLSSAPKSGGGDVELQGVVRDPSVVVRMENNVRDKYHEVRSKRVQERVRQRMYSWHFETSMSVGKRDKTQYVSHLPEPPPESVSAAGELEKKSVSSPQMPATAEQGRPAIQHKPPTVEQKAVAAPQKPAATTEQKSVETHKPAAEAASQEINQAKRP